MLEIQKAQSLVNVLTVRVSEDCIVPCYESNLAALHALAMSVADRRIQKHSLSVA
jgi:hypothetical protein